MTIPNLITSLARTDLIVFGVLVLSISASVLIPGTNHSPKPTVYASPAPTVDILPTHQVGTLNVSNIASEESASGPNWPLTASRSVFARPRVTCCSSPLTRKDGHMTATSDFLQAPLLLHISSAWLKLPKSDQSMVVAMGAFE